MLPKHHCDSTSQARAALCRLRVLGLPQQHQGCYDTTSRHVLTSRHVVFDELVFPFRQGSSPVTIATTPTPTPHVEQVPLPARRRCREGPVPPVATNTSSTSVSPPAAVLTPPSSPSSTTPAALSTPASPTSPPASPAPTGADMRSPSLVDASPPAPTTTSTTYSPLAPAPPPPPHPVGHPMITRRKDGIVQPNPRYANTTEVDDMPRRVRVAGRYARRVPSTSSQWHLGTGTLTSRRSCHTGKWIFKNKFHADGMLERRKARWVIRGFSQRPGLDFDQTFSSVV